MKQSIFNVEVSFLPCTYCDDSEIETISLAKALISDQWREKVEALRAETNPDKRRKIKEALPCFTPSGTFTHVSNTGLIAHSGFISVDIDFKPERGINTNLAGFDLKSAIATVPQVAYCGHSCSGLGYVLIIPIADPTKHRDYFRALEYHFSRAGLEIDRACKDITRKRFVSWDADPYINTAARPWSIVLPEKNYTPREILGHDLTAEETAEKVDSVIKTCEQNKWDITSYYPDWVRILLALASTFGESGREYAHRISAMHPEYNAGQTDKKYTSALKSKRNSVGIGTFFYIARAEIGKHDFDGLQL